MGVDALYLAERLCHCLVGCQGLVMSKRIQYRVGCQQQLRGRISSCTKGAQCLSCCLPAHDYTLTQLTKLAQSSSEMSGKSRSHISSNSMWAGCRHSSNKCSTLLGADCGRP